MSIIETSNISISSFVSGDIKPLRQQGSLQAFQAHISQRIAQAQAQTQTTQALLSIYIAGYYVLLLLDEIHELLAVPTISKVPLAKPWMTGLAVARAEVVTVFDLPYCIEQLFTQMPPQWRATPSVMPVVSKTSDQKCVLVAHTVAPQLAFLVETINGTVDLRTDGWVCVTDVAMQDAPAINRPSFVLNVWQDSSQQVHLEISLAALLQSAEFNQLTY